MCQAATATFPLWRGSATSSLTYYASLRTILLLNCWAKKAENHKCYLSKELKIFSNKTSNTITRHKAWSKKAQTGGKFEANPLSVHLFAGRLEILPQNVAHSSKTRRSKSLLSRLHLMAIMVLCCVQAKLQSTFKGSYSFFLIHSTKLIVLAVLITSGFLREYKCNGFKLHIICTTLQNTQALCYAHSLPIFLLRKLRDLF